MSKKSETKKPAEKKTTKTAPEAKAKAAPARGEAKKAAEAKPKKDAPPSAPAQEAAPAVAEPAALAKIAAAAMAAAKDLGLTNKTQNGFVFWGLSKPPRTVSDPLAQLERAWERYHGNVVALVKEGVTDENRATVLSTIEKHAQTIESLREKVA